MAINVTIFIDGEEHHWQPDHTTPKVIREDQEISLKLELTDKEIEITPVVFLEDYDFTLTHESSNSSTSTYTSPPARIFREAFGDALLRIQLEEREYVLGFEVLAKKIHAVQAEEMISYLKQKSEHIFRVLLSRTSRPVGSEEQGKADPEMILSAAENFVDSVVRSRLELQHQLRKRLIPVKQAAWKASKNESGIDPFDVLSNLDALEPAIGASDVTINGRNFSASGIDVTALEESADVEENTTLLGGVHSMRRVLLSLHSDIAIGFPGSRIASHDKEYVSLSELLLRLTSGGMTQRCERLITRLEELIRYFERALKIPYRGELQPRITPYVRASRVYRMLFEQLQQWYFLGTPSLTGRTFLVKLRSLSKIYEYFTLFKLFDYFESHAWQLFDARCDPGFEYLIPSMLRFRKEELTLTLEYEPKIFPFQISTEHLSLVNLKHSAASGTHWWPDFVLRIDAGGNVAYFILDAKYSTPWVVKNKHLPTLFDKYFMDMAVYDDQTKLLDHSRILGVLAIFPEQDTTTSLTHWRWGRHGLLTGKPTRLPIIAGLPLSPKSDLLMGITMDRLIDIAKQQTLH